MGLPRGLLTPGEGNQETPGHSDEDPWPSQRPHSLPPSTLTSAPMTLCDDKQGGLPTLSLPHSSDPLGESQVTQWGNWQSPCSLGVTCICQVMCHCLQ